MAMVVGMAAAVGVVGPDAARADVVTVAGDQLRTSWDSDEPKLTDSQVAPADFGQLFGASVDGQVYAQVLVIAGTVIAATENNMVYGLDGVTGARKWAVSLGPAWPASTIGCGDLTPNIGVTSTPVYDPATNSVYLLAKANDGTSANVPHWYMHALNPRTGSERAGFPVAIGGVPSNDPSRPFTAKTAMQRAGLLLLDGVVYAGFASLCDIGPYVGYIVGVSTRGVQTAMWTTESGAASTAGGIWQSGGGLVSDGSGQILFTTGNGTLPQPGPGSSPPSTLGESVVRLKINSDASLTPTDFFSPANNASLETKDVDLGSGAPLAVPNGYGTGAHPHVLVQVGKDGRVFLLDRDHLGGMAQGPGGTDAVLHIAGPYNGVWGKPAFLGTGNGGYVYQVENAGYLRAFKISPGQDGSITLTAVGTSAGTFGYSSGSPAVTSNGTDGTGALIWVVYVTKSDGTGAELRAYRALPDSAGQLKQVFSAPLGIGAKFSSVATDKGKVYVGTRDGKVYGFGARTAARASSRHLDSAPMGQ